MALYNYSKYNVTSGYSINWGSWSGDRTLQNSTTYYTSYSQNPPTGAISYSGPVTLSTGNSATGTYYIGDSGYILAHLYTSGVYKERIGQPVSGGTAGPGTYVGNVVAENGTYPSNGVHIDGYWYVRGSAYDPPPTNTAPTVPGKPTATGDFKPGGKIRVSWAKSTDAQGQTINYNLERREYKNGVAGNWLDAGATSLLYIDLTLSIDATITQIEFRVRAYDTLNAYSGFSTISDMYNLTNNKVPTINLATSHDVMLFEKDTFIISGTATDADVGNIINVKYQIGAGATHAIATNISDGSTPVSFNKQLIFKESRLWDGTTLITDNLVEGVSYQVTVWSEDDKGGKSAEQMRTFYVVPNRAPVITVDSIANQNDLINSDKLTISGTTSDPDSNDVIVKYKINNGLATQIYSGPAGEWTFDISLKDLVDGENSIVVEVTDTYNFKTSKTIKLNKTANLTPLSESVQRYKIVSPTGSAQGVLLWIQRSEDLVVSAEISMTNGTEQEAYTAMALTNSAPVSLGILEDEFTFQSDTAKENINVKLNITGTGAVTLISGVLN